MGDFRLTSITAYRGWKNRQHQDWDAIDTISAAIPRGEDVGTVSSDQFSQELRLTSPKRGLIDYVVGLYYFQTTTKERYQRDVTRATASSTPMPPMPPNPACGEPIACG